MAKRKKKIGYEPFKSWDEWYFMQFCTELAHNGAIREAIYEPYPFILTEGLYNKYTVEEKLKTKSKFIDKEQPILRPSSYTPDFLIFWDDSVRNKLFQVLNEGKEITAPFIAHCEDEGSYSIVEIKPSFDVHGKTQLFVNNQKFIWNTYEKFVNLIKITDLFKETFCPESYTKTSTGQKRKLSFKAKKIKDFLK